MKIDSTKRALFVVREPLSTFAVKFSVGDTAQRSHQSEIVCGRLPRDIYFLTARGAERVAETKERNQLDKS